MSIQILLSAFLAALSLTTAAPTKTKRGSWGGAVSLGPTKSHIVNAITTLIPGPAPATQAGELLPVAWNEQWDWKSYSDDAGVLEQQRLVRCNDWRMMCRCELVR